MSENLPYSTSAGTLEKMLGKIKAASTPERFTGDFVNTKLAMKGGTARACIPFLKKMGLVGSDGVPTDLYREFRNPNKSRHAVGKAFRELYSRLYEMNEYVHDASDSDILGLIVECTGNAHDNATTKYTLVTLNMLRNHADFESEQGEAEDIIPPTAEQTEIPRGSPLPINFNPQPMPQSGKSMNLSYTINLNLPATKDIEVFNAIFKSLKEHLLED